MEPEGSAPDIDGYVCMSLSRPYKRLGAARASGGLACYVRSGLSPFVKQWKASCDASLLWLKVDKQVGFIKDLYICLTYVWPEGCTHYSLPIALDAFDSLADDIAGAYRNDGHVLLAGDFNSRTATLKDYVDKEEFEHLIDDSTPLPPDLPHNIAQRCSCDQTVNSFGRKLVELCQVTNLLILNGRVKGDATGAFTFQTTTGSSVVDYFIASPGLFNHDLVLCVQESMPESDHRPLNLTITVGCNPTAQMASHASPAEHDCGPGLVHLPKPLQQIHKICHKPDRQEVYCQTLSECLNFHFEDDDPMPDDELCYATVLQECIAASAEHAYGCPSSRSSQHRHKPWYDDECKACRRQIMGLSFSDPRRIQLQREYKRLARRKRRQHELAQSTALCKLAATDAHKFWRIFKQRKEVKSNIGAQQWHDAYAALVGNGEGRQPPSYDPSAHLFPLATDTYDDDDEYDVQLNADISNEEVAAAFKRLKCHKAAGIDGIKAEFLLDAEDVLMQPLTIAFNQMLDKGVPEQWCTGVIHPIFKSGDANDPNNYRGITVTTILAKLFAMVLENRISDWAEGKGVRAAGQAGFRRDYRTTDNLLVMNTIVSQALKEGNKVYCGFVDFRKAFDFVPRNALWAALEDRGLSSRTLSAIKSAYAKDRACVLTQEGLTESFPCTKGVKQGCPASPLLFGLYVDELERLLNAAEDEIDAPALINRIVAILLFADDIALLSYSAEGLQAQLDILAEFCKPRGLEVNVSKTKVVVFEHVKSCSPAFMFCGQQVEQVDVFKYLGIVFHGNRGLSCAVEQLAIAAQKAMFAMLSTCQQKHISQPEQKLKLFDALVRPVLSYACEVWAPIGGKAALEKLEQVHKKFLRGLLGVPKSTCLKMLYAEFGRLPLQHFWWQQCTNYIQRLHDMDDSRLCKLAFLAECRSGLGWWKGVVMRCTTLGIQPPLPGSGFSPSNAAAMDQNMAVEAIMNAKAESRKEQTYFSFKSVFQMEKYITEAKNKHLRRIVANFRVGSHWLKVQTGRYHKLEYHERTCDCCRDAVDDEVHAIFVCPLHDHLRQSYADLFTHVEGHNLSAFLTQGAVHRIALFLTDCRALRN